MSFKVVCVVSVATTIFCTGFLVHHLMSKQKSTTQHNSSKNLRSKRYTGIPSDYTQDSIPYDRYKFKSTDEYLYSSVYSYFSVHTKDLDTYELRLLQWSTTPFDPTRQRQFGTRKRRPKTTACLSKMPDKAS